LVASLQPSASSSPGPERAGRRLAWQAIIGIGLIGYGMLIVGGVTPHESARMAVFSIIAGTILAWRHLPDVPFTSRAAVATLGAVCLLGPIAYNELVASDYGTAELALMAYGAAVLLATPALSRRVGSTSVGNLVAWSFPLFVAPMALYTLNALLSAQSTESAATPFVAAAVVRPTGQMLQWLGTPVEFAGNNLIVATSRGSLALGVGLACAGLYPMVMFGAILGLHAWYVRMRWMRVLVHLVLGLAALWIVNLIRLLILAEVGIAWGGQKLQMVHAHLGWLLFTLFMTGYWFLARPGGSKNPSQR
jgi:archaeosortase C (PEF-CTERM variant)